MIAHNPSIMVERTWNRTLGVWLVVALCLTVSLVTLGAMSKARHSKPTATMATPAPVITVSTATAKAQIMNDELVATGTIRAVDPLSVGAEVNGLRIVSVEVEEGTRVHRGQVLATLNRAVLTAQLNQARARYRGSVASVSKAISPNRPQDIAALEAALLQSRAAEEQEKANLHQARTNLKTSQRTAQRYSKVLDEGFVTVQENQDRTTDAERNRAAMMAAQSRLNAAHFATRQSEERLSLARAGGRIEDVVQAQSTSQEMAANIEYLQAQIDQTVIRAPEDGLVLQRDAHVGDIVSASKPLFTLARQGQMELRAQVPEIDLNRVHVGDRARTMVGDKTVKGHVWIISPAVDPTTRLGTVRILLDRSSLVFPGMFARATLALGRHQALVIPSAAVMGDNDNYFVFLYEDGKVRKQTLQTGSRTLDAVEVVGGLKSDARVVVKGAGFLADGDTVTAVEP